MGIVEVKDTEQHCFYRAKLLDVKQDKCLVQYEEAEGSTARQAQSWVHSKLVRREPPEQSAVRIEQVPLSAASLRADLRQPSCHPVCTPLCLRQRTALLPAPRHPHAVRFRAGVSPALRCHPRAHPRMPPPPTRALPRRGCPPPLLCALSTTVASVLSATALPAALPTAFAATALAATALASALAAPAVAATAPTLTPEP